jgi:MFS family permease
MTSENSNKTRWRILLLLSVAELFGMSLWLTASAVAPQLVAQWGIAGENADSLATWLTTIVQLGFVCGTAFAAVFNLADIVSSRTYFVVSALIAAAANAAIIVVDTYVAGLVCRFLVGFFLAGVYPPAMKMIATWFKTARGFAIGTIVGALTCGKATPYLIRAFATESYISVITISSLAAIAAGILVFTFYRDGPHAFPARKFRIDLVLDVLKHRPTRLAIAGYLGHMWELYAMWVWIPAFIASSFATSGASAWEANLAAFLAIATGAIGCVWGGWTADRIGRERLVNVCLAISGLTSLGIGLAYGSSPWIVAVCAGVWGFFVVADSAQFSTLVTEVSPPDRVGTALTLQTSIGFLLTTVTIQWVGFLKGPDDQWQWAFAILSIGPFLGIAAMSKLAKLRS